MSDSAKQVCERSLAESASFSKMRPFRYQNATKFRECKFQLPQLQPLTPTSPIFGSILLPSAKRDRTIFPEEPALSSPKPEQKDYKILQQGGGAANDAILYKIEHF